MNSSMNRYRFFNSLLLVLFLSLQVDVVAAQVTSAFGTIDEVKQDDGYIVIDGSTFDFKVSEVVINYGNRRVRASFLSPGLRISYITRNDGSISDITLIGPTNVLEQLDNH